MPGSRPSLATWALLAVSAIAAVGQAAPTPTAGSDAAVDPPEPSAHPAPTVTVLGWTAFEPRLKAARDVWFDAIAALPSGEMVVVGQGMERERPARAFVFDQSDPASWKAVWLPGRKSAAAVDVIAQDGKFVAVGTGLPKDRPPQVLVWRSADGRTWQRPIRIDDAEVRDLVATDEGPALLGMTWDVRRRPIPTLWRSTDGQSFDAAPIAGAGHVARRVARSPTETWIVAGHRTNADGYDAEYVLWRSDDGAEWETVELPFADPTRLMDVVAAEWTPSGFILVVDLDIADTDGASGEIWHSPEGTSWTRVVTSDVPFGAVATGPSRQVAFGSRLMGPVTDGLAPAPMVVYASSDGLDWQASSHAELDGVNITAATVVTGDEVAGAGRRSRVRVRAEAIGSIVRPVTVLSSASGPSEVEDAPR